MDKKYFDATHRFGRIGVLIGLAFMLGIPAVVCTVYDVWPSSVMEVFSVGAGLLAVFVPANIAEVLSYSPVLGSSAYIAFVTGNISNLKLPCALNAMNLADVSQGTDEGDTVCSIAIGASSAVTTAIIALGVVLLVPLQPILTSSAMQTASTYMLPALFGSLILGSLNENCGDYIAKGKLKAIILPVVLIVIINLFVTPLSGKEGIVMIFSMLVSVACAWGLYKAGQIKMIPKNTSK